MGGGALEQAQTVCATLLGPMECAPLLEVAESANFERLVCGGSFY